MSEYPGDWPLEDGRTIRLIQLEELRRWQSVEPEKILISIFGEEVKAKDCDDDVRNGFVAAGFWINSTAVPETIDEKRAILSERKG